MNKIKCFLCFIFLLLSVMLRWCGVTECCFFEKVELWALIEVRFHEILVYLKKWHRLLVLCNTQAIEFINLILLIIVALRQKIIPFIRILRLLLSSLVVVVLTSASSSYLLCLVLSSTTFILGIGRGCSPTLT